MQNDSLESKVAHSFVGRYPIEGSCVVDANALSNSDAYTVSYIATSSSVKGIDFATYFPCSDSTSSAFASFAFGLGLAVISDCLA